MLKKPTRPNKPPPAARDAALRLLSRREHSARELRRKLVARGVEADAAEAAIDALAATHLQSDARYAEQLIRTRITQGYGPRRIRAELEQAGLSRDAARLALEHAECDWQALAQHTLSRRFRASATAPALRRKRQQFLYARGFEPAQIDRTLGSGDED